MKPIYLISISILLIASCSYVQKIKDGTMAYQRKQYAVAVDMLKTEFNKEDSRVEKGKLAYMIGDSYKFTNKNADAISWYKTAYDHGYGIDALKDYAYALKANEEYPEAQKAFKELGIEIGSPYEYRRHISACKIVQEWLDTKEDNEYKIKNIDLNSSAADYAPTPFENGQLVFTSDRSSTLGDETYNWTGNQFSDLFVADTKNYQVESFATPINTANNEGTASFNGDFTEMIFTRCYGGEKEDHFCKLMMSVREEDSWTEPKVLNFTKENVNYGHPSITADGGKLYFAANDPEGWGGYDIWESNRTPEGWSEPKLLSRSINTIGNEKFPFLDKDTLYFSSDHHTGMGGLDIFKTHQVDDDSWSPVYNLKSPINSGGDDFGFMIDYEADTNDEILQVGYFTSTRFDGKGLDDIYRFEKGLPAPPPPPPPVDTTTTEIVETPPPPVIEYKLLLEVYVVEKIFAEADNPNSKVLGRRPLPGSKVDLNIDTGSGNESKTFTVNENGSFTYEMDENTSYYFFASKDQYLSNNERFSTKGIAKDPNKPIQKFEVEILLDKIFKNKEIVLENIYYDYDKWDIRSDAQPTLNALNQTLNQNPNIRIELASHTDCRGPANYNQELSQKRAQSAVDYLISKGIPADKLVAVGYGENSPAIGCQCQNCSEEEHQSNRRTTFKVVD